MVVGLRKERGLNARGRDGVKDMKNFRRGCLKGHGLVGSDLFCCGVFIGEFGRKNACRFVAG